VTRATLGACIGEGNSHFFKYSLLGHVYLLILIIIEEACKDLPIHNGTLQSMLFEEKLSRNTIYKQLALFPKEISAYKLSASAREAFRKFKNDYKISSFFHLIEWRISTSALESTNPVYPQACDYKVLIHEHNAYIPQALLSMQQNSENLAKHLLDILQLQPDGTASETDDVSLLNNPILDHEILDRALQHDLPIFVSIDGSLDENGVATTSISRY
jgi:hypothetical protein